MENSLLKCGSFGSANPRQLFNTLIYFFGLHLRAWKEDRELVFGVISRITLDISKNRDYGLKCSRYEPKVTRLYGIADKRKCLVSLSNCSNCNISASYDYVKQWRLTTCVLCLFSSSPNSNIPWYLVLSENVLVHSPLRKSCIL